MPDRKIDSGAAHIETSRVELESTTSVIEKPMVIGVPVADQSSEGFSKGFAFGPPFS